MLIFKSNVWEVLKHTLTALLLISCGGWVAVVAQTPMTLEECRAMALEQNKKIEIAKSEVVASDLRVLSAKTMYLPKIDFSGGWVNPGDRRIAPFGIDVHNPLVEQITQLPVVGQIPQVKELTTLAPEGAYLPLDLISYKPDPFYALGFSLKQPLFTGFKIVETNNIAKYGANIAREQVKLEQSTVLAKVDAAYWQVIAVQEKVKLAHTYNELLDKLVQDLENIHTEGMITRNELLKAKVKQNEAKLELLKAEDALVLSKMLLGHLIGVDSSEIEVDSTIIEHQGVGDTYPSQIVGAERAELAMLRNKVAIVNAAKKYADAQFMPNIFLVAGYNWVQPNPYKNMQNTFGGDWAVGIGMHIPVVTWGERVHRRERANQKVLQAELELQEATEMIELEIQQNKFKHIEALKKVEITKLSKEQAEENLRITKDSLLEGMNSVRNVLEAQLEWEQAASSYIDARVEVAVTFSELKKSMGALYQYTDK